MKYLSSLTIMMLVYISFHQVAAQTTDICSPSWWQQLIQNNTSINEDDINLNDLHRTCDQDGNTPLMIAYIEGVGDEIVTRTLNLAVRNTIEELFSIANTHGKSFAQMFLERHEPDSKVFLRVSVQLMIRRSEEAYLHPSPFFGDICDTSWWQQLESEDNIPIEDIRSINIDDLFSRGCNDGDTPLITALRANITDAIIINILEMATLNAIRELFNTENVRGDTLRTIFLREHNPGAGLFYIVHTHYSTNREELMN